MGEPVQCELVALSQPGFDPALEGWCACLVVIARNDEQGHRDRADPLDSCDQLLAFRLRRGRHVVDRHAHSGAVAEARIAAP